MASDDEKLVLLVQDREVLYNPKLKSHHNKKVVEYLWREVAEEMNMTVNDCKQKWTNLRNSYARHLRNQKRPSGSGGEHKPKWYLADVMYFLKEYMHHRKIKRNYENEEESIPSTFEDQTNNCNNIDIMGESSGKRSADCESYLRHSKRLSTHLIVEPMIDSLISNVQEESIVSEHPLLSYVKGLLPDYDSLTSRRQRLFKQNMVIGLNNLMDEQESEK